MCGPSLSGGTVAQVVVRPVPLPQVAELVARKDAGGRSALGALVRTLALGEVPG